MGRVVCAGRTKVAAAAWCVMVGTTLGREAALGLPSRMCAPSRNANKTPSVAAVGTVQFLGVLGTYVCLTLILLPCIRSTWFNLL